MDPLVCTHCGKPVKMTRQRQSRVRTMEKLGLPIRVYCDEACNTQYWNTHGRSKQGHWNSASLRARQVKDV